MGQEVIFAKVKLTGNINLVGVARRSVARIISLANYKRIMIKLNLYLRFVITCVRFAFLFFQT